MSDSFAVASITITFNTETKKFELKGQAPGGKMISEVVEVDTVGKIVGNLTDMLIALAAS